MTQDYQHRISDPEYQPQIPQSKTLRVIIPNKMFLHKMSESRMRCQDNLIDPEWPIPMATVSMAPHLLHLSYPPSLHLSPAASRSRFLDPDFPFQFQGTREGSFAGFPPFF